MKIDISLVQRWVTWACQLSQGLYPDHPLDLKVLIVICSLVIFYVDDILANKPEILHSFQSTLLARTPQSDPLLDCLSAKLLPRMWDYFEPLAANAITIGFYEFINGTAMELVTKKMSHHSSAPDFPDYVRLKSGAPTQYAYWLFYSTTQNKNTEISSYIQAIPDFTRLINLINDILSFYKEELAGEDDNFVHMRAKVTGVDVALALQSVCDETMQLIARISSTLSGTPEHLATFQGFISRYIRFHTSTTRYKLDELLRPHTP